jgi:hypothetical protein
MKIPGFTADASLCKVNESYYMSGTPASLINGREILPQRICFRDWSGQWYCTSPGPHYLM